MQVTRVAVGLLLAVSACSPKQQDRSAAGATQSSTPVAPAGSQAFESEYAELRRLAARVTNDERQRAKAEDDELSKAYAAANLEPHVLFEVPARECCPSKDQACRDQHLRFAGLCYENPTRELWGLGAFAIDDDGHFWVHDPVADRVVGFDRAGKVVDAVPMSGPIVSLENLVVTKNEVWLDSLDYDGDPNAAYLSRVDRKTYERRNYGKLNLIGRENEGYGWPMPQNSARTVRWSTRTHWDVVDVTFLDDTRMQISQPHPLHARGHRYWLNCKEEGQPAALVIDDRAIAVPGCMPVKYVGPDGDTVTGDPFYHYDVHGNVLGVAARTTTDFEILSTGNDWTVGPDGNAYQYVPGKRSVKFVQLPWFSTHR